MPYYSYLRYKIRSNEHRQRAIANLLALQKQLERDIPGKDADNNLLLATWNIRDFSKPLRRRRGFGKRLPETLFYIAEVISHFDIVALQEVNELNELAQVMAILGRDWDYIATDVTDTKLGGNGERLTFVFDKRKVWFQNIAGEIVLPSDMLISKAEIKVAGKKVIAGKQFRRTPFIASFQSNWLKFDLCTVHLYFGAASGPKLQQRVDEIRQVASYLGKRADEELKKKTALIILGDFNIVHPEHKTMEALLESGFVVPSALQRKTNIKETKYYDQIAFKTKPDVVEYIEQGSDDRPNAGVFKIFEKIFTAKQFAAYKEDAAKSPNGKKANNEDELRKYYDTWRTYQFSDHMPLWVRLKTNDSKAYLRRMQTKGR